MATQLHRRQCYQIGNSNLNRKRGEGERRKEQGKKRMRRREVGRVGREGQQKGEGRGDAITGIRRDPAVFRALQRMPDRLSRRISPTRSLGASDNGSKYHCIVTRAP